MIPEIKSDKFFNIRNTDINCNCYTGTEVHRGWCQIEIFGEKNHAPIELSGYFSVLECEHHNFNGKTIELK